MKTLHLSCAALCTLFAATSVAQPKINAVENNYSYVPPGLPSYGVAQGSIFVIFGTGLANTPTGLTSPPQTTLNGVSVSVSVGGTTKQVILYYVTATQIAGILPSTTPTGTGTITVTNNGQTSATAPITVVASAFGLLTLNGSGTGPAAVFDASFGNQPNYLGPTNAANPGDVLILWGSGIGPDPGNSDETVFPQKQNNLTGVATEVDIGGIASTIAYRGRSQFPGLDQINVVVPSGASGCYVSVVVRSGNFVSNFSSIPVAAAGSRTCSDQSTGLGSIPPGQALPNKNPFNVGAVGLLKTSSTIPATAFTPASTFSIDTGFASFNKITLPANYDQYLAQNASNTAASIGSCTVYTILSTTSTPPPVPTGQITTPLNAGTVSVTGPLGKKTLTFANGAYSAQLGGGFGSTALPAFIPTTGGSFTFDNGSGGPDVGAFTAQLTINPVVWTNQSSITTITRSQGVNITWTGGDPKAFVTISGVSYILSGTNYLYGTFTCLAPVAALQFTVPAAVLLALPASGSITSGTISTPLPGSLTVTTFSYGAPFTAAGLDYTYSYAYSGTGSSVTYQ